METIILANDTDFNLLAEFGGDIYAVFLAYVNTDIVNGEIKQHKFFDVEKGINFFRENFQLFNDDQKTIYYHLLPKNKPLKISPGAEYWETKILIDQENSGMYD